MKPAGSQSGVFLCWRNMGASILSLFTESPPRQKRAPVHIGPFGPIWVPYGSIWGPYGSIWAHMCPYGPIRQRNQAVPLWCLHQQIKQCLLYSLLSEELWQVAFKKKNQSFGTVCHREVCLTFLSLGAKISGPIAKFRGCSLKIQHWSSFHLNNLENCPSLQFRNSLKSMHCSTDWYHL